MSTPVFQRQKDLKFATQAVEISDITVVSPNTILLTYKSNQKIQMFDSMAGRVVSEVTLQGCPRGICLTKSDQAAVVVQGQKVQIVDVQRSTLTTSTVVVVKHEPWAITTRNNTSFVVSYNNSPWLEVITTDGNASHQFDKDGTTQRFKFPDFLTTSNDNYVYVSDWYTDEITKLDFSLQLLQTFSSPLLSSPRGIISISPDQLLVCSRDNNRVVLLNTSIGKSSTLLAYQDGIEGPCSLSYCAEQKTLYCARNCTESLNMYKFSRM